MKLFKQIVMGASLLLAASLGTTAFAASDCNNTSYQRSNGRTCASMGLDSNRPTCVRGRSYAIMCDDTRTHIRTCQSQQRCGNRNVVPQWGGFMDPIQPNVQQQDEVRDWVYYRGKKFHCTDWNFNDSKPCDINKRNPDCKGDCR